MATVGRRAGVKLRWRQQSAQFGLGQSFPKTDMSIGCVLAYFDRHSYHRSIRRFSEWMRFQKALDWQGGHLSYPGHSGTDFCLSPGTPILAMAGGLVTRIHNDLRGGLSVFIDHGGGVGTSYRHCSVVTRPIGQWVDRGGIIGLSGVSGVMQLAKWWLPAHVHVTVWLGGIPVDPFGESASMDDKGFWIVRNAPRGPQAGDVNGDYQFSWQWQPTSVVLKQTAEKHPIMWGNFAAYAHRMLPRYLSFDSGGYPLPRLTLPFHERYAF